MAGEWPLCACAKRGNGTSSCQIARSFQEASSPASSQVLGAGFGSSASVSNEQDTKAASAPLVPEEAERVHSGIDRNSGSRTDSARDRDTEGQRGSVRGSDRSARGGDPLRVVAGLDVSFSKRQGSRAACAALVAIEVPTLRVLWEDFEVLEMTESYVPGFLAIREVSRALQKPVGSSRGALRSYALWKLPGSPCPHANMARMS